MNPQLQDGLFYCNYCELGSIRREMKQMCVTWRREMMQMCVTWRREMMQMCVTWKQMCVTWKQMCARCVRHGSRCVWQGIESPDNQTRDEADVCDMASDER